MAVQFAISRFSFVAFGLRSRGFPLWCSVCDLAVFPSWCLVCGLGFFFTVACCGSLGSWTDRFICLMLSLLLLFMYSPTVVPRSSPGGKDQEQGGSLWRSKVSIEETGWWRLGRWRVLYLVGAIVKTPKRKAFGGKEGHVFPEVLFLSSSSSSFLKCVLCSLVVVSLSC